MSPRWGPVLEARREAHVVHLYREDATLVRAVATWAGHALTQGDAAVLIGTPAHRAAIRVELQASGVDAARAEREGRFLLLDADACMARFMRDGKPDRDAFRAMVHEALASLRAGRPRLALRAWGEMVDLLHRRGNPGGAMLLEDLWNEVVAEEGFRLLCSYFADPFDPALYREHRLQSMAHGHGVLLPVEDDARMERAVRLAMDEVCGVHAGPLRQSLGSRAVVGLEMEVPASQRLLAAMSSVLPDYGPRVIASAGAYYRAADDARGNPPPADA